VGTPQYPYLFATLPSTQSRVKTAIASIKYFLPHVRTIAVVGPDDATGAPTYPLLVKGLTASGYTVSTFIYPETTVDLGSVMTSVAAAKPDLVILGWGDVDNPAQISPLDASGLPSTTPVFGWASSVSGLSAIVGSRPYISDPFLRLDYTVPNPAPAALALEIKILKFTKQSSLPVDSSAILFGYYDIPPLLALAMQSAHSTTNLRAIQVALTKVQEKTASGKIGFTSGHALNEPFQVTYVNGKKTMTAFFAPSGKVTKG
jgi:ABC-type branched-subunit amino acid transport system substrate-binding protein